MTATESGVRTSTDAFGQRVLTHPEAATMTREILVQRARDMVPTLRERARRTEEARQMLPETIDDFTRSGFFRIVSPKRFGGFELGIEVLEEVCIELGRGCGSSSWCMSILGGHGWWAGLFDEAGQQELFGDDGHVIMATNLSGNGRAVRVEGGFEVSGDFTYLSGCDVSNWFCVGAGVENFDGTPVTWYYMCVRPQYGRIIDQWDVIGMRGTGSKPVRLDNVFVPDHLALEQRLVQIQEPPGRSLHESPMFQAPMTAVLFVETTAPAVGIALGAVEALDDIARNKHVRVKSPSPILQMEVPAIRRHLAEAKSLAETAKLLLMSEAERLMRHTAECAREGRKMSREEMQEYGLSNSRVIEMCVQAVDHCFRAGGTSSTTTGSPIERAFRDVHMIATHRALQIDLATESWARAHFDMPQ